MVQSSRGFGGQRKGVVGVVHVCILLALAYVVYVFALALISPAGFPRDMQSGGFFPYLADKPVGEDGYYMLTVAWNIASGRGMVYNFAMPTTGVQPLATAVYAMLAWVVKLLGGDRWLFARSVLAFGGIMLLALGLLVGAITRELSSRGGQDLDYALGFVGVVFNFALFRWFTYGLETGAYLVLFALCILYSMRLSRKGDLGLREALVLGALGGATTWARIDFGILFLVFLALCVAWHRFKPVLAVVAFAITSIMISPWFWYNYAVTGTWIPSSGTAQAGLISLHNAPIRLWTMGTAIVSHLTPWVYSNAGGVFLVMALLSLVILMVFLFRATAISSFITCKLKGQPPVVAWLCAVGVLMSIYVAFFWAGHFYQRYAAPLVVPVTAITAAAVAERIRVLSRRAKLVLLCMMPVCFFGWAFLSLHTGRLGSGHTVSAGFVQDHFSSVKVGAFQSGVIGFFNSNVVNLDGKVNQAALEYASDGRLHVYIDSEGIDVLVDWPGYIYPSLDADWLAENWEVCEVQLHNDASICLQRRATWSQ